MNLVTNARDALNDRYSGYDENKTIMVTAREVADVACAASGGDGVAPTGGCGERGSCGRT